MPYKNVDEAVKKHPNLKKYSTKARRGWVGSFNSCNKSGGSDEKCFAVAFSVANKVDGKANIDASGDNLLIPDHIVSHDKQVNQNTKRSEEMSEVIIAKELKRLAEMVRELEAEESKVEAAETFKCPDCGSKVLEQTGYCVKCQKKVKKAADLADLDIKSQGLVLELIKAKKRILVLKAQVKKIAGELKSELAKLDKRIKVLDTQLAPVLEAVAEQLVRVEGCVVAYDPQKSVQPKYKDAFTAALEKVNARTRQVLNECLTATHGISRYLDVEITVASEEKEASESKTAGIFKLLRDVVNTIIGWVGKLRKSVNGLEGDVDDLEKIVQ